SIGEGVRQESRDSRSSVTIDVTPLRLRWCHFRLLSAARCTNESGLPPAATAHVPLLPGDCGGSLSQRPPAGSPVGGEPANRPARSGVCSRVVQLAARLRSRP